jgi:hypothetical protein
MQMSHRGFTSIEALAGSTATETSCPAGAGLKLPPYIRKPAYSLYLPNSSKCLPM